MLLTIDIGNTNTVLGLFQGEQLQRSFRVKTDPRATADEMFILFRALLRGHPEPDGIALCSTV
ncbi:MAG TPA: type III pantothenate kinase, partial [Actinomycetota bacterium]|nr:type III pantothenate kinase [Actinomycetota bacterium]